MSLPTVNVGNQKITYDFKQPAKAEEFNTVVRDLISPGVYFGADLTFTGTRIDVTPVTVAMKVDGVTGSPFDKLVRVQTRLTAQLNIGNEISSLTNGEGYLYMQVTWQNYVINWAIFEVRPINSPPIENEVILGKVTFVNSVITQVTEEGRNFGITKEEYLGDKNDLLTTQKDTLVDAINDIVDGGTF